MKKLAVLNFFGVWLTLSVVLILFSGSAQADVYDHFTSTGIDTTRWTDVNPGSGVFNQPGGGDTFLYFNDLAGYQNDSLRSFNPVSGAFSVAMQYSDFSAVNGYGMGEWKSSCVGLMITADGITLVVLEGKNSETQFVMAVANIGGQNYDLSGPITTPGNSGWFRIDYNGIPGEGGVVNFWYDSGSGWQNVATYDPNFSHDPSFFIWGKDQFGTSLSFKVDQVQLTSTPLPGSVLLLGIGLLRLAGFRRFRKG